MSENNYNDDPWLYPGCPCYIWYKDIDKKYVAEFHGYYNDGRLKFKSYDFVFSTPHFYRPIGTPWDFVPKDTKKIFIDKKENCIVSGYDNNNSKVFIFSFPWPACPDHLKGETFDRPEWAKESK